MSSFLELSASITHAFERGATVVTGNQRAARLLRQSYDRGQKALGKRTWQPATVLAWDTWLASLWHDLLLDGYESRMLLSRTQELAIWQEIISGDRKNLDSLRSAGSLADLASQAWRLVAQYQADRLLKSSLSSFETRSYLRWADEFERRCKLHQWASAAQLEMGLLDAVAAGRLRVDEVLLVGFDDLTSARQMLIDGMRRSNAVVNELATEEIAPERLSVDAPDEMEEIQAAARWARNRLMDEPGSRIGIIVPSLESRRATIDRSFRHILAPELENIAALDDPPYEFSVGIALSETLMVKVALDLLRWVHQPLPVEDVSALLVSPLFARGEDDQDVRGIYDAFELRRAKMLLKPAISISWLLAARKLNKKRPLPIRLVSALESLIKASAKSGVATERQSYARWADVFREILRLAHWHDNQTDTSIEFQIRKRWEFCLDELASLDFMGQRVSYPDSLESLVKIAQSTIFAPESRQAPVQILGPLEAAGDHFDAIWFLGASDLAWPARHSYNPLLPWAMQKELGMPGEIKADNERDFKTTNRVAGSADTVIFSYSSMTATGKVRLSPIVSAVKPTAISLSMIAPEDRPSQPQSLESYCDSDMVAVATDNTIPGGADVLRLQAACAFRAFAEKRLHSSELRTIALGMDAMERGTVVHRTLEIFWRDIKSQENLRKLTNEERSAAIRDAIEESLHKLRHSSTEEWESAYIDVQHDRLRALISTWLEVETARRPFEVRLSEKEFSDVQIGPLRLNVRVDRVDGTEAGDVIVDYKTGNAKTSDWMSNRPDAPQLPLYAVISSDITPDNQLADIAFGKVHAGNDALLVGYTGKTDSKGWIPGRDRTPIEEKLQEWRDVLTTLAEDFHRGDARVDPKSYPHSCRYCSQRLLCRLDPTLIDMHEEMNDASEID